MTHVRITGRFIPGESGIVGRMCWITPDLAGKQLSTTVEGHTVRISFPERATDEIAQPGYNRRRGSDALNPEAVSPVYFTATLDWEIAGTGESSEDRESLKQGIEALRAGSTRLTDGIRLLQPSSGLAGEAPPAESLHIENIETGEPIDLPVPPNRSPPMAVGYPNVDSAKVERALEYGISTPEILLAQAAYWAIWTADPKPGVAVLLAAMACESRARDVMAKRVDPEMEPLLDVLFDKPWIFQRPAIDLFHHVAKAVLGRSLKDDDQALWKQVVRLFELRNEMAHEANEPSRSDVGPLVAASYGVFEWLARFGSN